VAKKLAAASKKEVQFTVGVTVEQLERFMRAAGLTSDHPLTEENALKLLKDKEFREVLFSDLIDFSTQTLEEAMDLSDSFDLYADVLNRLQVPHDGILETDDDSDGNWRYDP
jgi:hypothetical protein